MVETIVKKCSLNFKALYAKTWHLAKKKFPPPMYTQFKSVRFSTLLRVTLSDHDMTMRVPSPSEPRQPLPCQSSPRYPRPHLPPPPPPPLPLPRHTPLALYCAGLKRSGHTKD